MEKQKFQDLLQEKVNEAELVLTKYMPLEEGYQKTVIQAMNYSLNAGGKRLRPLFMKEVYTLFGGKEEVIEPFMAAIEMIHTYSLVHDDLPAMDNDTMRRGKETTWKVYGDGMGILAGDGLLNLAFETALKAFSLGDTGAQERIVQALQVLFRKAGIYGMIGGQTADVEAEEQQTPVTMEQILFIHEHKTAALIQASMMVGAILGNATKEQLQAVEKCAYNIGIAFQVQDDILDVIGDTAVLGKKVGSDEANHKQTYVTIKGLEESKNTVDTLSKEAISILKSLPGENPFLEQMILELIHRTK